MLLQQPLVVPVHHVSVGHDQVPQGLDPLVYLHIQLLAQLSHLRPKPRQFFGNRVVHVFVGATFILVFEESEKLDMFNAQKVPKKLLTLSCLSQTQSPWP